MKEVTLITGPLRSGTSCITGLLECCGFDLGRNIRVLRKKTEFNTKGHFELDLLFAINSRLLYEASINSQGLFYILDKQSLPENDQIFLNIPEEKTIAELAGKREKYFSFFIRKFDGNLCKDPLMCLTLPFWEKNWPELGKVIFCLRHPMAAARSMNKRYSISTEQGLEVWHTYVSRFYQHNKRCSVYTFDFDAFISNPFEEFSRLLRWLGISLEEEAVRKHIDDFFGIEHINYSSDDADLLKIPAHIKEKYLELKSQANHELKLVASQKPSFD